MACTREASREDQGSLQGSLPGKPAPGKTREDPGKILDAAQLTQAIDGKVEAVELERWITADAVKAAHDAGVRVILNIASTHLDTPETWSYLRARGVDTIMSDRADMAR